MPHAISRHSTKRAAPKAKPRATNTSKSRTKARAETVKSARLEARINPELRKMIKRAADIEGRKVSEFVTEALHHAAQQAIAEAHVLRLSLADQELFAQALLEPPVAAPALERAFTRHRDFVG